VVELEEMVKEGGTVVGGGILYVGLLRPNKLINVLDSLFLVDFVGVEADGIGCITAATAGISSSGSSLILPGADVEVSVLRRGFHL
jgi:hypothetical protein